ncbi:hypothetical protein [Bacillus cereus group sp. MYBK57-1]|uniref:hypothetical protein n=1 Tax=Bacillus cereus group sp. MYBK57-1 TaxID=3450619 RepID=UPI003F7A2FD3
MTNFPLKGSQHTGLGDHREMETTITISENGRIDGSTLTKTCKRAFGFTGSVIVFLTDSKGNILYATDTHRYGVNALGYLKNCDDSGDHQRTEFWNENIPQEVINNISGYEITHAYTPLPRVTPDQFKKWAEAIAPLIKSFNTQEELLSDSNTP